MATDLMPPAAGAVRGLSLPVVSILTIVLLTLWPSMEVRGQSAAEGAPTWSKRLQLSDGRMFVSDGAFALDASIADRPATETLTNVPGSAIERYFQAPFTSEIRLSSLTSRGGRYVTPDGIPLNSLYIDYLRRTSAGRRLRLRISGDRQPIVLMLDGRAVGVVMPMAK